MEDESMPKNDNSHSTRLVDSLKAIVGDRLATDFEENYPLFKTKFIFYIMILNIKNLEVSQMAADYGYWKNNGWLEKKRPW